MYIFSIITDSVLPGLLVLLSLRYYNRMPAGLKIIFWYLAFSSVLFTITNLVANAGRNNLFLYHFYTPVSFAFISIFFLGIRLHRKFDRLILFMLPLVVVFSLVNSLFIEDFQRFDSNTILLVNLLTIIYSIVYYTLIMMKNEPVMEQEIFNFWIISGFFVYASGTFVIYYFFKYSHLFFESVQSQFWNIQNVILIIKTVFLGIGFLVCLRHHKQISPG